MQPKLLAICFFWISNYVEALPAKSVSLDYAPGETQNEQRFFSLLKQDNQMKNSIVTRPDDFSPEEILMDDADFNLVTKALEYARVSARETQTQPLMKRGLESGASGDGKSQTIVQSAAEESEEDEDSFEDTDVEENGRENIEGLSQTSVVAKQSLVKSDPVPKKPTENSFESIASRLASNIKKIDSINAATRRSLPSERTVQNKQVRKDTSSSENLTKLGKLSTSSLLDSTPNMHQQVSKTSPSKLHLHEARDCRFCKEIKEKGDDVKAAKLKEQKRVEEISRLKKDVMKKAQSLPQGLRSKSLGPDDVYQRRLLEDSSRETNSIGPKQLPARINSLSGSFESVASALETNIDSISAVNQFTPTKPNKLSQRNFLNTRSVDSCKLIKASDKDAYNTDIVSICGSDCASSCPPGTKCISVKSLKRFVREVHQGTTSISDKLDASVKVAQNLKKTLKTDFDERLLPLVDEILSTQADNSVLLDTSLGTIQNIVNAGKQLTNELMKRIDTVLKTCKPGFGELCVCPFFKR